MLGLPRALAAAVGALLLILIGFPAALGAVAEAHGESAPVFVYAGHHHNSVRTSITLERGAPAASDHGTTYDPVGHWPHGGSARSSGPTTHSTYHCDARSRLVQVDNVLGQTAARGQSIDGDLSPFQRSRVAAKTVPRTLDELSAQGAQLDRNGLTEAGRALQKHANRAGNTAYPKVPGAELNSAGQNVLDDILTNPLSAERSYVHPNFGPVREFLLPDMGARFEEFGRLIGFL